jgi:hypothetical protein
MPAPVLSRTIIFLIFAAMIARGYNKPVLIRINRLFPVIVFLSLCTLIVACAVQSPISGGEKDIIPPKVVRSEPANFSTNFTGQKIVISFNEFVTLKDIDKQKLISPPLEKDPDFKMKGKSLVITFKEPFQKNATYSIYMGNAIVDITEANPLADYSFVFSTGSKIDSLGLTGNVMDALDQTPPKDAIAMLYDGASDSLPFLKRPLYVARVSDKGDFWFLNLRSGYFKLIVLQDQNNNFLYDKGEAIAFADTLLPARHDVVAPKLDSLGKPLHIKTEPGKGLELTMFKENDSIQHVLRAAMMAPNHLQLATRLPVKRPKLKNLASDSSGTWYLSETNAIHDTLNFWLKNVHSDSLHFTLSDGSTILDTLNVSLAFKGKGAQKAIRSGIKLKLRLKLNVLPGGSFPLHTPLMLISDNPLIKADFSAFKLVVKDSITFRPKVQFSDSLKRRIIIKDKLLEGTQYQLIIPDSVFEDMYGQENDSISVKFKTRTLAEYGSLTLKLLMKQPQPYIIQLLTDAGKVLRQDPIKADGKISYPALLPGKYKIKAILDSNRNGKWDTGNLLKHIQPEKVIVFPKAIDLRGNWEQEEDWQL